MPTISIRVSDELKSRLDELAHESEATLSSVIINSLNSITSTNEEASSGSAVPRTISVTDRQILRNQELLLAANAGSNTEERDWHRHNAEILEAGYTWEYWSVFAGLQTEISSNRCEELYDILDMFRVLRCSYDRLSEEEQELIEEGAISFAGFDYNKSEESALAAYVEFLFEEDKYTELKEPMKTFSDEGNSHHPVLETYRRMNRCFKPIWRSHRITFDDLRLEEMQEIVAARSYDSGY